MGFLHGFSNKCGLSNGELITRENPPSFNNVMIRTDDRAHRNAGLLGDLPETVPLADLVILFWILDELTALNRTDHPAPAAGPGHPSSGLFVEISIHVRLERMVFSERKKDNSLSW